jgi:hypothetical protein
MVRCHRAARRLRTRLAAVCLVLALGFVSSTAWADASFALTWRAKPGVAACVTEAALRDALVKKLGRDPFTARDRADIAIEGEEVSLGGRFRARVQEKDRNGVVLGSRELDAESCARLMQTTTIVVALFIEPYTDREPEERTQVDAARDAGARDSERAHAHIDAEAHLPVASSPAPVPSAPSVARRSDGRVPGVASPPFDLALGFGGTAAVGLLPSASVALRGVARLEREGSRWSFEWSGGYSLPQSFRSRSVRGTFSAVDQQVRVCLSLTGVSRTRLDACGGAYWGAIVPDTTGVRERDETWRPLAGPLAALAVRLDAKPRSARLDLGLVAPKDRRSFYYESSTAEPARVHVTGRVIVFLGVSGLFTIL